MFINLYTIYFFILYFFLCSLIFILFYFLFFYTFLLFLYIYIIFCLYLLYNKLLKDKKFTKKNMDIYYIQARYKNSINLPSELISLLPKKIVLTTTIQYFNSLLPIKKQLEDSDIQVSLLRGRRRTFDGQILGCMTPYRNSEDETIVYIGDGLFHPKALLIHNSSKVITYNPKTSQIRIFTSDDVHLIKQKIKAVYTLFLSAKNVGVLLSVKNGQSKPELTSSLQNRYPQKNFYFFADNTYDFSSLENFPFIEVYLNTMCERIALDDALEHKLPILNVEDLFAIEKE